MFTKNDEFVFKMIINANVQAGLRLTTMVTDPAYFRQTSGCNTMVVRAWARSQVLRRRL